MLVSIHVIDLVRVCLLVPVIWVSIPNVQAIVHIGFQWRWKLSYRFVSVHIRVLWLPIWVHTVISSVEIIEIEIRIVFFLFIVLILCKSTQIVNSTFCVNILSPTPWYHRPASRWLWLLIISVEIESTFGRRWLVPVQIITVIHCLYWWLLYIISDIHTVVCVVCVLSLFSEFICILVDNGLVHLCIFAIVKAASDCCHCHLIEAERFKAQYLLFVCAKYLVDLAW